NGHAELSVDVGQVMFGPATTVTADGPVEHLLYASSGRKWVNVDTELETGCGIVPYTYREKAASAAMQWAVGLELFLLAKDPWRGRRRDRVRTGFGPGEDVRGTSLRDQGRSHRGGRGSAAPGARRSAARRAPRLRHRGDEGREAVLRRLRHGRIRELWGGAVKINDVTIEDTFAEAFTMRVARLVITGRTLGWAREAAVKLTGFATSVIG